MSGNLDNPNSIYKKLFNGINANDNRLEVVVIAIESGTSEPTIKQYIFDNVPPGHVPVSINADANPNSKLNICAIDKLMHGKNKY